MAKEGFDRGQRDLTRLTVHNVAGFIPILGLKVRRVPTDLEPRENTGDNKGFTLIPNPPKAGLINILMTVDREG